MPMPRPPPTSATLIEIVGQAAAVEHVIGGERADLAGRAIEAHARVHLEGVPLDARLELLEAIVRKAHRAARDRTSRPARRTAASAYGRGRRTRRRGRQIAR